MFHTLKTVQPFFDEVLKGEKTFELRKNDRGFSKGDTLILQEAVEVENAKGAKRIHLTGSEIVCKVTSIVTDKTAKGLYSDYCILSFTKVEENIQKTARPDNVEGEPNDVMQEALADQEAIENAEPLEF